jgi:hypothetical protein
LWFIIVMERLIGRCLLDFSLRHRTLLYALLVYVHAVRRWNMRKRYITWVWGSQHGRNSNKAGLNNIILAWSSPNPHHRALDAHTGTDRVRAQTLQ